MTGSRLRYRDTDLPRIFDYTIPFRNLIVTGFDKTLGLLSLSGRGVFLRTIPNLYQTTRGVSEYNLKLE